MRQSTRDAIHDAIRAWARALATTAAAMRSLAGRPRPRPADPPVTTTLVAPRGAAATRLTLPDGRGGWRAFVVVGEARPERGAAAANEAGRRMFRRAMRS